MYWRHKSVRTMCTKEKAWWAIERVETHQQITYFFRQLSQQFSVPPTSSRSCPSKCASRSLGREKSFTKGNKYWLCSTIQMWTCAIVSVGGLWYASLSLRHGFRKGKKEMLCTSPPHIHLPSSTGCSRQVLHHLIHHQCLVLPELLVLDLIDEMSGNKKKCACCFVQKWTQRE